MLARLAELRKQRKWSIQETADQLGMAKSTYAGYESGYREPSLQSLSQIADLFETTVDFILGRAEETVELADLLNGSGRLVTLDKQPLSTEEITSAIAFVRTLRTVK